MDRCLTNANHEYRIELDTFSDVKKFVATATAFTGHLTLKSGKSFSVNAKSLLGVMLARKINWNDLVLVSDTECYEQFASFIRE